MKAAIRGGDLAIIHSPVDVLGVQYYTPTYVDGSGSWVTVKPTSDASWEQIYPTGLYDLLTRLKRDYADVPLVITENGRPSRTSSARTGPWTTSRASTTCVTISSRHTGAVQAGVRLEGYLLWSLMDNFEWAEGYGQRWGIVYVEYPTQRRIPKISAAWYRGVATRNGI